MTDVHHETIRQFERRDVYLEARIRVADEDIDQIAFSGAIPSAVDRGTLRVSIVDIAGGGVGIHTEAFLPRNMRFTIEILEPADDPEDDSGSGAVAHRAPETDRRVLISENVVARRCQQISRHPLYHVGLAFDGEAPEVNRRVEAFLERLAAIMQLEARRRFSGRGAEGEDCA